MKRRKKELQLKREENTRFLTSVIITLIFILAVFQVYLSNHLATLGEKISRQEQEINQLSLENERSSKQLSQNWSLTELNNEAQKLGLAPAVSILYLTPEIPVALK